MSPQTAFITAADAIAYLGVRRDKIYELCRQRRIPSIKLGHRTLRIPRDGFFHAIDKGEIFESPYGLEKSGQLMNKPQTILEYRQMHDCARKLEAEAKTIVEEWIEENLELIAVGMAYKPLPGLLGHHVLSDGVNSLSVWYDVFASKVLWT